MCNQSNYVTDRIVQDDEDINGGGNRLNNCCRGLPSRSNNQSSNTC